MAKTLELVFLTETGATSSIMVDFPKEPVNPVAVKAAMDTIITSDAFYSTKGKLVESKGAKIIERNVTEYEL